jgi:hypothetical protein
MRFQVLGKVELARIRDQWNARARELTRRPDSEEKIPFIIPQSRARATIRCNEFEFFERFNAPCVTRIRQVRVETCPIGPTLQCQEDPRISGVRKAKSNISFREEIAGLSQPKKIRDDFHFQH